MNKKYFWRRGFAYAIDVLICGFFATLIVLISNSFFSTNILAPELLKSTQCEVRDDLFATERMNELLPLEEGQSHQQVLCKQTNMFFTSFYITRLQKSWTNEGINYNVNITYYSDESAKQVTYIPSEPFFLLLAPLIFALFLARQGQTPGKRLLRLTVYNNAFDRPDLKSALKREYLKALLLVIGAMSGLYTMFSIINFDLDEIAKLAQTMPAELEQSNFFIWAIMGVVVTAAAFWFQFGSFIRWRGRTYWDQFANLNTNLVEEFQMNKDLNE